MSGTKTTRKNEAAGKIGKRSSWVSFLGIPLLSLLVGLAFLATPLELKLSDLLMRFDSPAPLRPDVLVLEIDDESLENLGSYPLKRSVYADMMYVLKNLGAAASVMDILCVDKSPVFYDEENEGPLDVDEAFTGALRLPELSVIPITMCDYEPDLPPGLPVEERAALNVRGEADSATPDFISVWPPLAPFVQAAGGFGFVNVSPDTDGHTRSVHLLGKSGGAYYGLLAFVPLLRKLGNPDVIVSTDEITLKGIQSGDGPKDLHIPRCADGRVTLCFPKTGFESYESLPIWNVVRIKYLEDEFIRDLRSLVDSAGEELADGDTPLGIWETFEYVRDSLADGYSDEEVSDERYASLRKEFFDSCASFLAGGPFDAALLARCKESLRELTSAEEKLRPVVSGAICITGTTATGTTDWGITLYEERYPNVGIHYVLANQILNGDFRRTLPVWGSILLAAVICFAYSIAVGHRAGAAKHVAVFLAVSVLFAVGTVLLLQKQKVILPLSVPVTALCTDFIASLFFSFILTSREKSFIHSTFGRYISTDVVNEILKNPEALELGGDSSKVRTAMFTDIQGFTTISENIGNSKTLVQFLNRYLTSLSDCIITENGTIDKYEGDAIISFFGAPIYQENHAERACRAAIQMKQAEAELNRVLPEEEAWFNHCVPGGKIRTRIGINCGRFTVGNVGTLSHMNYTMIGSDVNLASRLEGANKFFGSWIIISQPVRDLLGDGFLVRKLDAVTVVGAKTPIQLYELIGLRTSGTATANAYLQIWEKAFSLYTGRNYRDAAELFTGLYERSCTVFHLYADDAPDMVAKHYMEACQSYITAPPPDDWNGVVDLKQK